MIPTCICMLVAMSLWAPRSFAVAVIDSRDSAFRFLKQLHVGNDHVFVYRLAHVVNRQQCDGNTDQGFHLDSRLRNGLCSAFHLRTILRSNNIDVCLAERQSMAKRNELCSLLGGLDPGNTRGREDIAFGDLIPCDQIERFSLEPNLSACNCSSFTERLR